jgi:hypothetical protein
MLPFLIVAGRHTGKSADGWIFLLYHCRMKVL